MADVEIYASMFCGFCYRAKQLLDQLPPLVFTGVVQERLRLSR